jgi:hypothetical protein
MRTKRRYFFLKNKLNQKYDLIEDTENELEHAERKFEADMQKV